MGAVLSIYGLGLLLCLVAGVALAGVLDPRGRPSPWGSACW
jgi:hypothetical protein